MTSLNERMLPDPRIEPVTVCMPGRHAANRATGPGADWIFHHKGYCVQHHKTCWYRTVPWSDRNELPNDKTNKMACAPREDSVQPGHPPSLIRVFAVRMKKHWILSYRLSALRRLWSDWADAQADLSLHWAHSHFGGFVMRQLKWSLFSCILKVLERNSIDHTNFINFVLNFLNLYPRKWYSALYDIDVTTFGLKWHQTA